MGIWPMGTSRVRHLEYAVNELQYPPGSVFPIFVSMRTANLAKLPEIGKLVVSHLPLKNELSGET